MENEFYKRKVTGVFLTIFLFFCLVIFSVSTYAGVIVTPAPNGSCLNILPGAYTSIGTIIITENSNGDIGSANNKTLILTAPAGFQFNPGTGSVSYALGKNITSASLVVTSTTITVTFSTSGTNKKDALSISGIQARATSTGVSGSIQRTAAGGTASISGDANGGGVDHGTLTCAGIATTTGNGNWNDPLIWSTLTVPSGCDSVVIGNTVSGNAPASVGYITIKSGGTLTANNSITLAADLNVQTGGVLTINGNTIDVLGTLNSNGTINVNSGGTLTTDGAANFNNGLTVAGTYNSNATTAVTGTLTMNGDANVSADLSAANLIISSVGAIHLQEEQLLSALQ